MRRPLHVGRTTGRTHAFFMSVYQVKSLIRYHQDMETDCATSDVKRTRGGAASPQHAGLAPDVLPEVQKPSLAMNSPVGVSTRNVHSDKPQSNDESCHWYALRTTYGRERKAYEYLLEHDVEVYCPTLTSVKMVGGKRVKVEESRIPNIFFAHGTEEEIKAYVYDNVNLPYLRFYCRRIIVDHRIVNEPVMVPDSQMKSLKIICASESDDIVATTGEIERFKQGQKVRITEGKFKGVEGVVARYQSQQRVGIIIGGLLTVCTAYVPSGFIEIIID